MLNNHDIFYVTSDHTSLNPTLQSLKKKLNCHFEITTPTTFLQRQRNEQRKLLIIEFSVTETYQDELDKVFSLYKNCHTVIVNAPETITTSSLIRMGKLKGYFLAKNSTECFVSRLDLITKGHYCLPQSIAFQLLSYYQSVLLRHTEPHFTNLTQREMEVLQYLKEGISNNKLADALYVSEHTIKSHLYKIFKKIDVKNRNQAIAWAHKFLP